MTGNRMVRPDTAFSVASTRQKRPRVKDSGHLDFIRSLNCVICGAEHPDAAHIRSASMLHGKRHTGMAEKPSDKFTVPLCRTHHTEQHDMSEILFWRARGIDPFGLALALYAHSGDYEIACSIIEAHRQK